MKKYFFILFCVMLLANSNEASDARISKQNSILAQINKSGFVEIGKYVKNSFLKNMDWTRLPDQSTFVDGHAVYISGIFLATDFNYLKLAPGDKYLSVEVGLSNIRLFINRFDADYMVPVTCYNSYFTIGYNYIQPLATWVQIGLLNGRVSLASLGTQFYVPYDNYYVSGPQQCTGPLGLSNPFIRNIVYKAFLGARDRIQEMVSQRVCETLPQIEDTINKNLTAGLSQKIEKSPIIPDMSLNFKPLPETFSLSNQGVQFKGSLKITRIKAEPTPYTRGDTSSVPTPLGKISLSPNLANDFLAIVFKQGSKKLELTNDLFDGAEDAFNQEGISQYLPDLLGPNITQERLRAFIKLNKPPILSFDNSGKIVRAKINDFSLSFMANINNEWRDYFDLSIDLDVGLDLLAKDKIVYVKLAKDNTLSLKGSWASSYTPNDATFNKDLMQKDFIDLLGMASSAQYILKKDSPSISQNGKLITLGDIAINMPYVEASVVSYLENQNRK